MPEVKTHSIGRAAQKDSARASLRVAACLLLAGQLLYIAVTQLHAGGDANNHRVIFAIYAANDIWTAVHLGQFASMVILLAGLFALFVAMDARKGAPSWTGRFGAAVTVATLALYGVLQAVDGVALKRLTLLRVSEVTLTAPRPSGPATSARRLLSLGGWQVEEQRNKSGRKLGEVTLLSAQFYPSIVLEGRVYRLAERTL